MHEPWWGCIGHNNWFWYWPSLQEVLQRVWCRHPDLATIWWWEWWANLPIQVLIWVTLFGRCGGCNLQFFHQALCSSSQVSSWPWQNGYRLFHSRQPPNVWILQPILCSSLVWFWPIASSAILQEHTEASGRYQCWKLAEFFNWDQITLSSVCMIGLESAFLLPPLTLGGKNGAPIFSVDRSILCVYP